MPRKKKPKAAPQRPEIDYSRRGAELRDLKDVRVGDPYCRLILFALDNLIGSNFQYIDKTLEEIRELCEMSRTTFYDRVNRLKKLRLISVEDIQKSSRKRWRIGRMNLSELANESRSTKAREETRSCTKADRVEHVRHTDAVREADDPVRLPNAPVRQADESVREPDGALITRARTRSKHAPSSLPSSDHSGSSVRQADRREGGRKGGVWDLVDRLAALGIAYPEPDQILKRPLGRGCELDLLHAIVDYWEAHRDENGWKVAALGARIREASPSVPPDQGNWPKPAPVERPRPSAATANEAIQQRCPTCGARPPHYPRAGGQAQCTTCSDVFGPFVLIRTAKT